MPGATMIAGSYATGLSRSRMERMRICGTPRLLDALLERFHEAFSAPQYRHFSRYVAGLMIAPSPRTVLGISRLYFDYCDQSALNRFLLGRRWSRARLAQLRRKLILELADARRLPEEYFVIDDTTLERTHGYAVEASAVHHSGTGKNCRVRGHCIVTSHLLSGDFSLPLDLRLYDKRRTDALSIVRGKSTLACDLVKHCGLPRRRRVVFLADSWYFCRRLVDTVSRRGWDWIFAVRANRVAWFRGEATTVGQLRRALEQAVRSGGPEPPSLGQSMQCVLPGIGRVQIVFWYLQGSGGARCLATNRLDWSPQGVISRYARRGRIEMFYWSCKQSLGLGEYRVRKAIAAIAHWQLVFCAYTLLAALDLARPRHRRRRTIGRICEWVVEQAFVGCLRRAYALGRAGDAWSLARCAEAPAGYLAAADG